MIWACTVTSSAVVGSSAMSTVGSLARAIAIIARCRMPPENSCGYCRARSAGVRDADLGEQVDGPAPRRGLRRPRVRRDHLGDLVADAEHRVQRRQRVLEDHREVAAAHAPLLRLGQVEQRAALQAATAAGSGVGAPGTSPMTVIADTDLPDPDSPDDRERLPRVDVPAHPVDGLDHAGRAVEVHAQVAHLQPVRVR